MDLYKILQVLEMTLPVFALMAVGKLLAVYQILKPDILAAINKIVVYFSLPPLIFIAIASQPFKGLLDVPIIVSTIVASFSSFLLLVFLGVLLRLKGKIFGAFIPSGFWANMAYMGFPLAVSAFGVKGLEKAAVVNGFTMPLYVFFGSVILSLFSSKKAAAPAKMILNILLNPIVLSCFAGLLAAIILDISNLRETREQGSLLLIAGNIVTKTFKLAGSMGLPLALISVGASLKLSTIGKHRHLIAFSTITKLVITPLVTYLIIFYYFPGTSKVSLGSAVLLMTMPTAVVYTVVSQGLDMEGEFTAAVVVVTTIVSLISIPIWLYVIAV